MKINICDYKFDCNDSHGKYYYTCQRCGHTDWCARYDTWEDQNRESCEIYQDKKSKIEEILND